MSTKQFNFRNKLSQVMNLAWQFVRKLGFTMSEALKVAWMNIKLREQMKNRIVKFHFQKIDGSVREAYGTLVSTMLPPTKGTGKPGNPLIQTYYDTEREQYRCFKKANLLDFVSL